MCSSGSELYAPRLAGEEVAHVAGGRQVSRSPATEKGLAAAPHGMAQEA
jgi:hypothetical protein